MSRQESNSPSVRSGVTRRKLLGGVSIASITGLSGCGGIIGGSSDPPVDEESTSPPETSSPAPTETSSPTPTQTATPAPTPISIGPRDEPDLDQYEAPTSPEPDWVVANDGSGDYETIDEALKITESSDIIEIKSGEYTVTGSGFSALVGSSREETTISFDRNDIESAFSVYNATLESNSVIINTTSKFYNCDINFKIDSYETPSAKIEAINTIFNSTVRAESLKADGCTFDEIVVRMGGGFSGGLDGTCDLSDCIINGIFTGEVAKGSVSRCEFNDRAIIDSLNATDSLFSSGVKGGNTISNCRAESGISFSDTGGPYAVIGGKNLEYSEVVGKIGQKINNITGCKFRNVTEGNWPGSDETINYADTGDKIANNIEYSAFIDGELVINDTEAGTATPSVDHNYYSAYDGSDEDNDGIIDKPYPIPGGGDVVDRNPLASEEIVEYLQSRDSSS